MIRQGWWLALLVFCCLLPAPAAADTERWLHVAVNHVDVGYTALVYVDDGQPFIRGLDMIELGLPLDGEPDRRHAGENYYNPQQFPDHEAWVDEINQRLHLVTRRRGHDAPPPQSELLVAVTVNRQPRDEIFLVRYSDASKEMYLVTPDPAALGMDEDSLRLLLDDSAQLPLHALAGENYVFDYRNMTLELGVNPEHFLPRRLSLRATPRPVPQAPDNGLSAMLGYDLIVGDSRESDDWHAGVLELAVGEGTTMCSSRHAQFAHVNGVRRLESRCIIDWPESMHSLTLGDEVTRGGRIGYPLRYGGIRFGTDYGLQPHFVTTPAYNYLGTARIPSTLEVWVDETLAVRREIEPGVHELTDVTPPAGPGEVRAVIRNALGVQEIINASFYSDPQLLAPGLVDWSFHAGRLRSAYGFEGNEYGERFALVDARRGFSDWLTLESRLESADDFSNASLGGVFRIGTLGLLEATHAMSETDGGVRGEASAMRLSRRGRHLGFALSYESRDPAFVTVGMADGFEPPVERTQASIGVNLRGGLSLGVNGFRDELADGSEREIRTATLGVSVGHGSLSLVAIDTSASADVQYMLSLVLPFGERSTFSAGVSGTRDVSGSFITAQRGLGAGSGMGYRVSATDNDGARSGSGELFAQNDAVRLRAAARHSDYDTAGQMQLSGSVIVAGGTPRLSRQQFGSAAIVELPASGVRIYRDNQLVAVTDADGVAVITDLRPYERNRVRFDITDLPMNMQLETPELLVVPGRRHVVSLAMESSASRFVSATLRRADGSFVPVGAHGRSEGGEDFVVGHDGFVYLAVGSRGITQTVIEWRGGSCQAQLVHRDQRQAFINAGEVACR